MAQYVWLIPLLPLIAFILIVFVFNENKIASAATALTAVCISFIVSVVTLIQHIQNPKTIELSYRWLTISPTGPFRGLNIEMGLLVDPLTTVMLFIVTCVSTLVVLYSIGYMREDESFSRFFAYLSLFIFSMCGLVIANNYFQTLVFWELVGFCSYLLIGFWYNKPSAADASQKAFITNRWADFGFMTGIILLFVHFGTFNFGKLSNMITNSSDIAFLTLVGILVFIGPVGKSGQFPLHVWLPDAMEGPTPISALIHAATMVAAGVYLIARGYMLFSASHTVLLLIAYLGGFTAIFAASIALVQRDIKRILAYSTLSQLGYMIMALGVGSLTAGMFHLTMHAFFKALLFLCAGSIIHALHEQDIFKLGKLKKDMPVTKWSFVIGALALAGIFPFAGFWSKDEILMAAYDNHFIDLFVLGSIVSFMTAFYMFRLIFVTFFTVESDGHNTHESPWTMSVPLILLSIFSVFGGMLNSPWFYKISGKSFSGYILGASAEELHLNLNIALASTLLAVWGIFAAWLIYGKRVISSEKIKLKFNWAFKILDNKYYIDNIYGWLFNTIMLSSGKIFDWFDHKIIDGIFDGFANSVRALGKKLRLTQTGQLQNYALVIFAAVVIIMLFLFTPIMGGAAK